jgi:choline-sulfatase/uncharacterized sulfatase
MSSRPNILFILSDQHNAKILGHKGHPDAKTPNIDRLAREGVRFDNAIAQNPICTPSRVSYFSGQYCHNHGIYGLCGPKPNGIPTMLGHFRKNGYTTAAIGKIHCPENWVEEDSDLFLEVSGCSVGGNPEYRAYIEGKGLAKEHTLSEKRSGPYGQCMDGYESPLAYRDAPEGWSVTRAIEFMKNASEANTPFFCHASFPRPHETYAPAKEFWDMYDENALTMPPNWQYEMKNKAPNLIETVQDARARSDEWTVAEPKTYDAGCRRKLRGYFGNISMVDFAVGELLSFLKEAGIEDNTIVIYASDHGDYACEHGIIEKAPGICSDAITRIPYIWRWPGHFRQGHVEQNLVETVDVMPTLCTLAGLEQLQTADGKDITNLLHGKSEVIHDISVTEFAWSKSIRKGNFRYVYYPRERFEKEYPDGFGELYDIENDPWEMNNLYFEDAYKDKVAELKNDLMDWLVTTTRVVSTNCSNMPAGPQATMRYKCAVNADGKINPDCLRDMWNMNYV